MKVLQKIGPDELVCPTAPVLERVTADIISALTRGARQSSFAPLWPASAEAAADDDGVPQRLESSRELAGHFRTIRQHAREHCPESLLPKFEDDLTGIEATVRSAVRGHLAVCWDLDYHVGLIEPFRERWTPYLEPPPAPPLRVECKAADRSVWLDGRCLATEMSPPQFGFVNALSIAYPGAAKWKAIRQTATGCKGGNSTRLLKQMPWSVRKLVKGTSQGYVLRLPEKLSTGV